jgi:hypothetical protein
MFRRDLALVFGSRLTWCFAAFSSLLIGHGFVQSLERAGTQRPPLHALDPMLFGLYMALCFCGPLIGARVLSLEKDRHTFHAHLLQVRSIAAVVLSKWIAATCGVWLLGLTVVPLLCLWHGSIGRAGMTDSVAPLLGYAIYSAYVAGIGMFAAAFTPSFRGAALLAMFSIAWNLSSDASTTIPALAFMQSNVIWSPGTYLQPFEQGRIELGALLWLIGATTTLVIWSGIGCRFDLRGWAAWRPFLAVTVVFAAILLLVRQAPGVWDLAQQSDAGTSQIVAPRRGLLLTLSYAGFPAAFLALGLGLLAARRRAARA